jgi:hypothetical protein
MPATISAAFVIFLGIDAERRQWKLWGHAKSRWAFSPRDDNPAPAFLPLSRPRGGSNWTPYCTILDSRQPFPALAAVKSCNRHKRCSHTLGLPVRQAALDLGNMQRSTRPSGRLKFSERSKSRVYAQGARVGPEHGRCKMLRSALCYRVKRAGSLHAGEECSTKTETRRAAAS